MELHNLFSSFNIIGLIVSRGMRWATSVFEGNENCEQKFRRKTGGKEISLQCRYNGSIRIEIKNCTQNVCSGEGAVVTFCLLIFSL